MKLELVKIKRNRIRRMVLEKEQKIWLKYNLLFRKENLEQEIGFYDSLEDEHSSNTYMTGKE